MSHAYRAPLRLNVVIASHRACRPAWETHPLQGASGGSRDGHCLVQRCPLPDLAPRPTRRLCLQHPRDVRQAQLLVRPQRRLLLRALDADAHEPALPRPVRRALQPQRPPHALQRLDQLRPELLGMPWRRRDAQALLSDRHRRVVNRLYVDPMLVEQHIARALRQLRIPHQDRHDVRRVGYDRQPARGERRFQSTCMQLLQRAVALVGHLMHDGGARPRHGGRRQRGGEDEARGQRADGVDHGGAARDIAAHAAVGLAERAGDDVDAVQHRALGLAGPVRGEVEVLGDAGAARAVHADGVNFIQKSDGAVALGQVADGGDGADGAAHGVDGLEGDDLGDRGRQGREFRLQVGDVVVAEDDLARARVADALDHAGVVHAVGQDDAAGQPAAERGQRRVVGHVARREHQRRLLRVQLRQLRLESEGVLVVARDVARAAGPGAVAVQRRVHRAEHLRVAAHAQVIVGAPYGHTFLRIGHVGAGELLRQAIDVVEVTIGLVGVLLGQLGVVEAVVVELGGHGSSRLRAWRRHAAHWEGRLAAGRYRT